MRQNHLTTISATSLTVVIGAVLWLRAVIGDAAHGVQMFPVLKQHSERMAHRLLCGQVRRLHHLFADRV